MSFIGYSGSHGTGKTTAAFQRGLNEKLVHPDKSVHILCNQEALCPYPINKQATPDSQLWIFTNQMNLELYLLSHFDIVVSDRTTVDVVAYTYALGFHSLAYGMMSLVSCHACIYQEIVFKEIVSNEFCHPDGIREIRDRDFRYRVEARLREFYGELILSGALNGGVICYD